MFIIIGIVVAVAVVGIISVKLYLSSKENKAIELAQEYLSQKYDEEMNYESIRFSWIDPSLYHVSFSPANNPELVFEVLVQQDLTIQGGIREFGQSNSSADNYCIKYFEYLMEEFLSDDAKRLWGDDVKVTVLQINSGLYSFSVPPELNNTMSLNEMEALLKNYWIYIKTSEMKLDDQSLEESANRIFEFIQVIKNNGFMPETIDFWYPTTEDETTDVALRNLNEIDTVDQVMGQLKAELAK
ncbi:MAG: hypothetical protein VR68_12305 [Peptococcaceae bacterium BRH_c4a]|nr:MAG: hypothetical protein VR68_12305 [Peptococcaceae bacterium BRH_c4a]